MLFRNQAGIELVPGAVQVKSGRGILEIGKRHLQLGR
jgi:hypothetical protein